MCIMSPPIGWKSADGIRGRGPLIVTKLAKQKNKTNEDGFVCVLLLTDSAGR